MRHFSLLLLTTTIAGLAAAGAQAQEGLLVYSPNFNDNTVGVYTTQNDGTLSATTTIGSLGFTLLFNYVRPDQAFAYVAARSSNTISVIDTATQTVVQTIAAGTQPSGMVASPDGMTFYTANGNGEVTTFTADPVTGLLTAGTSIDTGAGSGNRDLEISPDGSTLYVVDQFKDQVNVIDTATNTVTTSISVGDQPLGVAVSPDGSKVYVSNFSDDTVSVIDTATNTVTATLSLSFGATNGLGPDGVTTSPDGSFVYVANRSSGNLTVIDAATNTSVAIYTVGPSTNGVAVSPDGAYLYVSSQGAGDQITAYSIDSSTGFLTSIASVGTGDSPLHPSICGYGDTLLASGNTFVANAGAALRCTGTSADFTGGTLLVNGTGLDFDTDASLGSAGGTVDTNGNTATLSGTVSGSGGLTKSGSGTLTLSGTNTYTGATAVSAGTLQAGSTSAFGSNSAVTVASGATLDLAGFSNAIGSLAGAGTVTTSTAGSATLTTGGDNSSTTFSGSLEDGSGTLGLTKTGSGTLTLSGTSTHTGATDIQAGILAVNGSIASDVTVSGGRLQGTGTVGSVSVQSGGTFAPGNSIGTTTVSGNVSFASGSDYEVEVNDGGTTAGTNNDLISASGTATLDSGASVTVLAENGTDDGSSYAAVSTYTILTAAGGITGTFGTLNENFAFLDGALSYDTLNVYLTLTRNDADLTSAAQTLNQLKTASALEDIDTGSSLYAAVISQSASGARAAYDDLSGEIHASLSTVLIEDARFLRNAAYDRSRGVMTRLGTIDVEPGGGTAQTATYGDSFSAAGSALWITALGGFGDWSATGNTAGVSSSSGGFLAGADGVLGEAVHLGLMGGYQRASVDVNARASSSTVDSYLFGLYGSTHVNALALRFGGSYAWHGIDTNRSVTVGNFSDSLSADYTGRTLQAFAEAGYEVALGAYALEPFAGLAHVNLHTDGFTESGGAAALTVNAANSSATFSTLGLRAGGSFDLGQAVLKVHGGLGWQHAFGALNPSVQNSFAGGADFSVWGAPIARDVLTIDAGLDLDLTENATLGVAYDGYLSGDSNLHDVKANLTFRF
ncbi:autotransporter domain-containing protein [Roseibium sp. Sym1]|uniref:autotransporter domain-containing protein n=1 Tax=Roseibium sp. Sym1 TaxID=3016006 RepID=UPI0022B34A91|nr:autotransporter domain-containing protein [Roseibium sp. Sym1]